MHVRAHRAVQTGGRDTASTRRRVQLGLPTHVRVLVLRVLEVRTGLRQTDTRGRRLHSADRPGQRAGRADGRTDAGDVRDVAAGHRLGHRGTGRLVQQARRDAADSVAVRLPRAAALAVLLRRLRRTVVTGAGAGPSGTARGANFAQDHRRAAAQQQDFGEPLGRPAPVGRAAAARDAGPPPRGAGSGLRAPELGRPAGPLVT